MANGEFGELRIFGGVASKELTAKVAAELGVEACIPSVEFPGGEVHSTLPETVRGDDVFVISSHCVYQYPSPVTGRPEGRSPQDAFMDHLFIINAAHSSWPRRVIAVAPHLGYVRQDRRTGRQSISAALTGDMIKRAGADGLMAVDLHSRQAEGFFPGPYEHLTAGPTFVQYARDAFPGESFVVVSPDSGRFKEATRFRNEFGPEAGLAVIDKQRQSDGSVKVSRIIGTPVKGRQCILNDDMIDGAGTIAGAAEVLQDEGASSVVVMATHGIFSGMAAERLAKAPIDQVVVTDTVPMPAEIASLQKPQIEVVSIAAFLARAIRIVHEGGSVQQLHGSMPQRI